MERSGLVLQSRKFFLLVAADSRLLNILRSLEDGREHFGWELPVLLVQAGYKTLRALQFNILAHRTFFSESQLFHRRIFDLQLLPHRRRSPSL